MTYTIARKDNTAPPVRGVDAAALMAACESLSDGGRHALDVTPEAPAAAPTAPPAVRTPVPQAVPTPVAAGHVDATAKARIEAQHSALGAAGVAVDTSEQFYATGTRMASGGYTTQEARKREHDALRPARQAAEELRAAVESEQREDRTVTAGELGRALEVNGKVTAWGLALSEHAIRGLALRLESPMTGYVVGLRDRIVRATESGDRDGAYADRRELASVIAHECSRAPDVPLTLRTRQACRDVYAIVSPSYTPADAPALLAEILPGLPREARGSWAYDPQSTAWELRAQVWTPTPVAEQCVGEAFEGWVSFTSRDAGNGRLRGGGGVTLLRCLNASTYNAASSEVSRTHRARILVDVSAMMRASVKAIDALCKAWGMARDEELPTPAGVPIGQAIPGFWRYALTARTSDLAGVLPGRTETHVQGLTRAWEGERRDPSRLVRSDLAQGWTRYVQGQPGDVRRDAESAIGAWLVSHDKLGCDLR